MRTNEDTEELLRQARAGDQRALDAIFVRYRERLRRMVEVRLDSRLQSRIDPSDVIQEAYLQAAEKLDGYLRQPKLPVFLWLRLIVGETLIDLHRHHLLVQARDPRREAAGIFSSIPSATTHLLVAQLLGTLTSPSQVIQQQERSLRVQQAIDALEPLDREILVLRHAEELSRAETAVALGITPAAAAKRYVRALARLRKKLPPDDDSPGDPCPRPRHGS